MAIVKTKETRKPILEVLADGKFHPDHEIQKEVAKKLRVTPAERKLLLASNTPVYKNRTAWGLVHLQNPYFLPDTKSWILKTGETGGTEIYKITAAGRKALRNGFFYAT